MAQRMPLQRPNYTVVGLLYRSNLLIRPAQQKKLIATLGLTKTTYPTFQKRSEPSEPPLQKSPSWIGCQATALASFLCPLNVCTSWDRLRKSNSFSKWSLDAVTSQLPLLFHRTSITVDLCAWLKVDFR